MLERRKFIRIPQSAKIAYKIASYPRSRSSVSRNVGKGGINFYAPEFIPVGTVLRIQFSLKEQSYDGFARVIWFTEEPRNERYIIGATFMNMPKAA